MSYGSAFFKKSGDYRPLYQALQESEGKERTVVIFRRAGEELDRIIAEFPDIPKGEKNHTHKYIFPRCALYRVLKAEFGDRALGMIEDVVAVQGQKMSQMLHGFTAFPFMERLFLKIFAAMARNMFGESSGFAQQFHASPKGMVKFDILDCTYCRYCRKCGCPELIHSFCESDAYNFGHLAKLTFERTQTLEHGEKCDFMLKLSSQK